MSGSALAEKIDALLPQTQCTKCGYSGCLPYARAIAAGAADFNQCPPGGAAGIAKLAALLGRESKPLNPANGSEKLRALALIDEARCIDCTLCVAECPVEAIYAEDDLPENQRHFIALNAELARQWQPITVKKDAPPDADDWLKVKDKLHLLKK